MKRAVLVILIWALVWLGAYILNLFNYILNFFTQTRPEEQASFGHYCYGFLLTSVIVVPVVLTAWEEWEETNKQKKQEWENRHKSQSP